MKGTFQNTIKQEFRVLFHEHCLIFIQAQNLNFRCNNTEKIYVYTKTKDTPNNQSIENCAINNFSLNGNRFTHKTKMSRH